MKLSLSTSEIRDYVVGQLFAFFPLRKNYDIDDIQSALPLTLERLEYCFQHINHKKYCHDNQTYFNPLYSDQYLMFIYFLSNTIYKCSNNIQLCDKLFSLNKMLNGICIMYDLEMPKVFLIFHGMGTVLGKAECGEFFFAYHNVTIGSQSGVYPKIGRGVSVFSNSSIIGECTIGNFSSVGAHTMIYQRNLGERSLVYTDKFSGTVMEKKISVPSAQHFFNVDITV